MMLRVGTRVRRDNMVGTLVEVDQNNHCYSITWDHTPGIFRHFTRREFTALENWPTSTRI